MSASDRRRQLPIECGYCSSLITDDEAWEPLLLLVCGSPVRYEHLAACYECLRMADRGPNELYLQDMNPSGLFL